MIRPGGASRAPRSHSVLLRSTRCLAVGGDNRIAVSRSRMVALFLVVALVAVVAVVVVVVGVIVVAVVVVVACCCCCLLLLASGEAASVHALVMLV